MIAPAKKNRSLDAYLGKQPSTNGTPRPRMELGDAFDRFQKQKRSERRINAKFDAASDSDELKNYWANSDAHDADSAHDPAVRAKLVRRSRYEVGNNGFADGIASTYSNDLVGTGPTLRMKTGSEGFNRLVEREWRRWTKEIKFRRKLWCSAHATFQDGEGLGVMRRNRGLRHPVKLDWVLHETEQCATPYLPFGEPNYIDGIRFDEYGNPLWYDFLESHPGSNREVKFSLRAEPVPARFVTHWYKLKRPGQHRGIPASTSTLNLGAMARRWREAVVGAAENVADFSLFIKTAFEPDELDAVSPMSTLDIQKRMMTALPSGYDAFQPKAEQPTASHAEFSKALVNEQARPVSMPLNKAAADSSDYNYASGRLDHQTYYGSLDVDREDCNDCVLDPLFDVWFDMAVVAYGWLGGNPETLSEQAKAHEWDWPKHQVADIKAEADSTDKRLKNGSTSLAATYSSDGEDYEDELVKQAESNGITVDEQRKINLVLNVPQHAQQAVSSILGLTVSEPPAETPPTGEGDEQEED